MVLNPLSLTITKQDFSQAKNFEDEGLVEKIAILRMYFEEKLMGVIQPSMFYCEKPFLVQERKNLSDLKVRLFQLGHQKCMRMSCYSSKYFHLNTLGYKNLEFILTLLE